MGGGFWGEGCARGGAVLDALRHRGSRALVPWGSHVPPPTRISERLGADAYNSDKQPHLRIDSPDLCRTCVLRPCIAVCPAQVYGWDGDRIRISWENCLELGACRVACLELGNRALTWDYPRAGRGVIFRQG